MVFIVRKLAKGSQSNWPPDSQQSRHTLRILSPPGVTEVGLSIQNVSQGKISITRLPAQGLADTYLYIYIYIHMCYPNQSCPTFLSTPPRRVSHDFVWNFVGGLFLVGFCCSRTMSFSGSEPEGRGERPRIRKLFGVFETICLSLTESNADRQNNNCTTS